MSLAPQFEIGMWNAWILTLFFPLHPLIVMLVDRLVGTGDIFKKMGAEPPAYRKNESVMNILGNYVLFSGLFIYSIFLPLQLGTAWFYAGVALSVLGMVTGTTAIVNIADAPLGEVWTKGLYRYSRHPGYLAVFLMLVGAGIASASWVFLLFSVLYIVLIAILSIAEEHSCLENFGTAYREYTDRTRRWIGIPKIAKAK